MALSGLLTYLLFYSTDRSKAAVPVLVSHFVAFLIYSTRPFVLCLALCDFVLVFFFCCFFLLFFLFLFFSNRFLQTLVTLTAVIKSLLPYFLGRTL